MRPSIKIALVFTAIWFTGKMLFFWFQVFQQPWEVKFMVMWNILCLLLAVSLGSLYEKRRQGNEAGTAMTDIKNGLTGGFIYSLIVGVLIYVYYAKIDPDYNARQIERVEVSLDKALNDPEQFEKIKQNPDFGSKTKQEIRSAIMDNQRAVYSAGSTMTVSWLGMLILSTLNSVIVAIIYRRILFRRN